jgi:hypothetical protein
LEGNPVYEPPNCCPDRDQAAPDSLSLKQIRKKDSEWLEKLRIQLAELEKQQAKQPSLADLVDWDEAFAEEIYAIQMEDGDIWVCERYCVSSKGHYRPKGLHHLHKRNAPLAHDWRTPLKRPANHTYTDEEPEHRIRHDAPGQDIRWTDSKAPSDVPPYRDDAEVLSVRRDK